MGENNISDIGKKLITIIKAIGKNLGEDQGISFDEILLQTMGSKEITSKEGAELKRALRECDKKAGAITKEAYARSYIKQTAIEQDVGAPEQQIEGNPGNKDMPTPTRAEMERE